ncbi:MAG: phage protease [Desulfuromonadaceae bacterium]|nr:phage protease [Desulfuromonadaceae bacterium]
MRKTGKGAVSALNHESGVDLASAALNFELTAGGSLPEQIVLLPAGENITGRDGRSWRNGSAQQVVEYLEQRGCDLVLDFEHATELKAPQGEQAPAAAWLNGFALQDGQVVAKVERWTPAGEKAVSQGEYRYISPVILYNKNTMEIKGISSVGLTNRPNLHVPALNQQQPTTEVNMLKKLLAKLGLPEDATEEQALSAIATLKDDLAAASNAQQPPDLNKFVPRADFDQLQARAANAEQKLATAASEQLEGAINQQIDEALKGGKIAPASKDFYAAMCRTQDGLEQFKQFVATAPVIAGASGLDGKNPDTDNKTALNAEQQRIAQMFGNTAEDIAKYTKEA